MTLRQKLAVHFTPIPLRLVLAIVFIYAGAGKLFYTMPVAGEGAAALANLGFIDGPAPAAPSSAPTPAPPAVDIPAEDDPEPESTGYPDELTAPPPAPIEAPADDPDAETGTPTAEANRSLAIIPANDVLTTEPKYTAADFPEPIDVSRRLGLVLMMHGAAESGDWPGELATKGALWTLSWVAVLTEFLGGWLLLLGFLTRFWSSGLAITMLVALWLTQIAPSIGSEGAFLGFLPALRISDPAAANSAWQLLFLQLTLLASALALFFSGPGGLSVDRILFSGKSEPGETKPKHPFEP